MRATNSKGQKELDGKPVRSGYHNELSDEQKTVLFGIGLLVLCLIGAVVFLNVL